MRSLSAPLAALLVLVLAGVVAQAQGRDASPYPQRATRPGAEPQAVALVDDALAWLARHQGQDGHWSAAGWQLRCTEDAPCAAATNLALDHGLAGFDTGVTALGALAFLGHGHTPQGGGAHAAAIDSALTWLVARQGPDGSIGQDAPAEAFRGVIEHGPVPAEPIRVPQMPPMGRPRQPPGPGGPGPRTAKDFDGGPPPPGWALYNHAVATLALCEAVAMGADPGRFRAPAQRALDFVVFSQNPGLGWKYGVRSGRNDSSMTSWMAQALRAGRDAGLQVPQESVDGVGNWFDRVTDSEGLVGYETPGGGPAGVRGRGGSASGHPAAMTAAGWFVRVLLGAKVPSKDLSGAAKQIVAARPAAGAEATRTAFMHLYYGASFLALRPQTRDTRAWRSEQVGALVAAARRDGCARGSFEPTEGWCVAGGRVYATALAALALEAPWRLGGLATARPR